MNKNLESRDIEQDALIECLKPKKLIISDGDELLECPCAKNNIKPKTNFDKITSSVDALVEYVINNFHNYPEAIPCLKDGCDSRLKTDCIECFKKWLEQEA